LYVLYIYNETVVFVNSISYLKIVIIISVCYKLFANYS